MPKYHRSKTNHTYFQDIPKQEENEVMKYNGEEISSIIKKLKRKYILKEKRVRKVEEAQLVRKEIYNLSQEINELELECDTILIDKVLTNQDKIEMQGGEKQ